MDLAGLTTAYTAGGWSDLDRTHRLFEAALTACIDEEAVDDVAELCRRRYRETALKLQDEVLKAVRKESWPPDGVRRQTRIFDDQVAPLLERRVKTVFFMVDSLRYEMGRDLREALSAEGEVELSPAAAVVPTVTDSGMAALLPGADGMIRLVQNEDGLCPALGTRLLRTSADRMRLLNETYGDRFLEITLDDLLGASKKAAARLEKAELLVVRTQDPDAVAENLGSRRARSYLSDVIGDIAAAVRRLIPLGFACVVVSADHGHVMLSEIPPGDVVQPPPGGWPASKRRRLLGAGLAAAPGTVTLKAGQLGIQGDVQDVCFPVGFRVFEGGRGYFHGGLSLQEAVVPVVVLRAGQRRPAGGDKPVVDIRYRSDRFNSRVIGLKLHLQSDIFKTDARVRVEAYDGPGARASVVGDAADCEARDEITGEVTLQAGGETPIPVLINPDFDGAEVEIRVSDPQTGVVWARKKLRNAMLD